MLNTPLKPSPLQILSSEFIEISLKASPHKARQKPGEGAINVGRTTHRQDYAGGEIWTVMLTVRLEGIENQPPPAYTGCIIVQGAFQIHKNYAEDPERLIRITATSMLYGTAREMLANLTARSANGMTLLPSVSFYEDPPVKEPETIKRTTKKSGVK